MASHKDGVPGTLPPHLQDDAPPVLRCTLCGRKSWTGVELGLRCNMPQPDNSRCGGKMLPPGVAGTSPAQPDDDEAYRQFQRDRIEEARRHDAEEARPKLTAGVKEIPNA